MAVNSPNSPRQKMINLMYLVFIAMLALNVSVEVLDGFGLVDKSLQASSETMNNKNDLIMKELVQYKLQNPEKAEDWYNKGLEIQNMTDSLINYIQELKLKMVRDADGKNGDIENIKNKDNLDVASKLMLSPINGEGKKLKNAIDNYRKNITQYILSTSRRNIIEKSLETKGDNNKRWEETYFENMPLAAAITLLTKIENDIITAEGDALENILRSVDINDFRVNQLNAYVIPESDIVIQGGEYNARVILSAEDTTKHSVLYLNSVSHTIIDNNLISIPANSIGTFPLEGYLEINNTDGTTTQRNFSSSYTVIEPMASIAPSLMNVLYAGIENEISISVPGISPHSISASMSNGTLTRRGNIWVARPNTIEQDVTISVSAQTASGTIRQISSRQFRVRALPDPAPFISYRDANENQLIYKGGNISKSVLMNTSMVEAAIDDGFLNIPFKVTTFRTIFFDSMGNAIPEVSKGNLFSDRQKEQIRRLPRGSYFYISGIKAAGPDGTEREIAVMEIRVN